MPSDGKSSQEDGRREQSDKDKRKEAEAKRPRDDKSGKTDPRSRSDKKVTQTAAEIRAEEHEAFIRACVESHGGWLSIPISNISSSLSIPPLHLTAILGCFFTLILLISPRTWIPWISAPVVLLIPAQNTLRCLREEKNKRRAGGGADMAQWIVFWIGWAVIGWLGEWVRVLRPGWRGVWEIGKVGAGVTLAGPWFGKAALIKGKPSAKLAEAEKREQAGAAREEKEVERASKEKDRQRATEEKRAREKAREKAKAAKEAGKQKDGDRKTSEEA